MRSLLKSPSASNSTLVRRLEALLFVIACAAGAMSAQVATAQNLPFAVANISLLGGAPVGCSGQNSDGTPLSVSCSWSNSQGVMIGTARVLGSFGHLGAFADSEGESAGGMGNLNFSNGANVATRAGAYDVVTINSPGRTGTGLLNFSFYVDAQSSREALTTALSDVNAVSLAGVGYDLLASAQVANQTFIHTALEQLRVDRYPDGTFTVSEVSGSTVNGVRGDVIDALGYFHYSVPFTFGSGFVLGMELRAATYAEADGIAKAGISLDATNSFDWAGIDSVTVGGLAVPFTVASDSGTDWTRSFAPPITTSVPEPGTYPLVLVGLGLMFGIARFQRTRTNGRL